MLESYAITPQVIIKEALLKKFGVELNCFHIRVWADFPYNRFTEDLELQFHLFLLWYIYSGPLK